MPTTVIKFKEDEGYSIPDDFDIKKVLEYAESIRYLQSPVCYPHFHECDDQPDCNNEACIEWDAWYHYYQAAFNYLLEHEYDIEPTLLTPKAEQYRYDICAGYADHKERMIFLHNTRA